jgi:hypothetical protein
MKPLQYPNAIKSIWWHFGRPLANGSRLNSEILREQAGTALERDRSRRQRLQCFAVDDARLERALMRRERLMMHTRSIRRSFTGSIGGVRATGAG